MKATFEGEAFKSAIKTIAVIFDPEIEVLLTASIQQGTVCLESAKNGVYFKCKVEANVEEEGSVVIACSHFAQLPLSKTVSISTDGQTIAFKAGKLKGSLAASSDWAHIKEQRPEKDVQTDVVLPANIFRQAVSRVTFGSSLPGAQAGIRIQAADDLTVSTTDGYRATLFKEKLAVPSAEIDVLLQPAFLHTLLSRLGEDSEVRIGVNTGTFRLRTDVIDVYHPAIQTVPEDIEEWINTGIDYDARLCEVKTTVEDFSEAIREVSAIHMGAVAYDTHVDFLVKGNKAHLRCKADHGNAQTFFLPLEVNTDKFITKISSKYALEMLNLAKAGDIEVNFWDAFLFISGCSGKFKALIPTVAA